MRLERWQKNALDREVPTRLDGHEYRPFLGSRARTIIATAATASCAR